MNERELKLMSLYAKIYPNTEVTRDTIIKGTPISKLCAWDGPPYHRMIAWCEKKLAQHEEQFGKQEELFVDEPKPVVDRETKFSGDKDSYEGGATRDKRDGKGRYDLISPLFLRRLAKVLEVGAKNHGDNNWKKGIPFSRLIDSSLRHISQFNSGMRDEDHIIQAVCNLMFLIHFEEENRVELDDISNK